MRLPSSAPGAGSGGTTRVAEVAARVAEVAARVAEVEAGVEVAAGTARADTYGGKVAAGPTVGAVSTGLT